MKTDVGNPKEEDNVDNGRAWLIAFASSVALVIIAGISYSVGIYNMDFLEEFQQSKSLTSWLPGTAMALSAMGGPIGSVISNQFSIRTSVITGGLLIAVGLFCSAFLDNIWLLLVFFGFITGFGMGISYSPSVVILGFYFKKHLNLANALIGIGESLGTLVFPFITRSLIDWYGWRGSLMILAGFGLNVCVCGFIMKPHTRSQTCHHDKVCDMKLFLNWRLVMILVYGLTSGVGFVIIYVHLPAFVSSQGASEYEASLMISAIGMSGLFGKFIIGIATYHPKTRPKVTPLSVCVSCFIICGTATCLLIFYGLFFIVSQIVYSCIFGLCSAPLYIFVPALTLKCVGLESLSTSLGLFFLTTGLGYLAGAPLAGLFFDSFDSYDGSFLLSGFCWVLSAVILVLPFIHQTPCLTKSNKSYRLSYEDGLGKNNWTPASQISLISHSKLDTCIQPSTVSGKYLPNLSNKETKIPS